MTTNIKNDFYHMTPTINLELIRKNGLQTQTGENCKVDNDNTTRVYFAEGIDGLYQVVSRFMKVFEYNQEETDKEKFAKQESERHELAQDREKFTKRVFELSRDNGFFDEFARNLKSYTYLQLDLKEDIDFVRNDDERMTKSNMYTDKSIDVDKINQVVLDKDKNTTAYDFVKYIYMNYQDDLKNRERNSSKGDHQYYLQLLDAFIEREMEKEKAKDNVEFIKIAATKDELLKSIIDMSEEQVTSGDIENVVAKTILNNKNLEMDRKNVSSEFQKS